MRYAIREIRESIGMNMEELANKANITRPTLWRLETKEDEITTTKTLFAIADALGVKVDDLVVR